MPDNLLMLTVDTLKAYQDLIAANLSDAQAQAIVGVVKTAQETWLEKLATKEDITAVRGEINELRGEINEVRGEINEVRGEIDLARKEFRHEIRELESRTEVRFANLEAKIDRVKFDLLKWLLPFLLAQLALVVTILLRTPK
jgi:uncharacterized coiled-coil DUF342 family protein